MKPRDEETARKLEAGRQRLLSGNGPHGLLPLLRKRLGTLTRNIYILDWIPEQAEDSYDLLIDGETVARVEVPRHVTAAGGGTLTTWTVDEYTRENLPSKLRRRTLRIAIELSTPT